MAEKPVAEIEAILGQYRTVIWHHCPDSRGCHGRPGMPDFIIAGPGGKLWREAKPDGDRPRGDQLNWKYTLIALGCDYGVWTPTDVVSGRVRREIEAIL
jgi:hypothetical protein